MHNTNLDLENLKLTEHIKKLMMSIPPEDPIERRKYIIELNKKGVAANPPEIKYLTGANIENLPSKLKAIVLRAEEDEEFYIKIKKVIETAITRLVKYAKDHETFCNYFNLSTEVDKYLLKLFGLSANELKQEMAKINFFPGHRQLGDPFYQTLSLVYLIGLYKNDQALRVAAVILIAARLWNGMIKKFFPLGCDPDIARYVQQYLIQNNSDYKRFGSPFAFITSYLAIRVDKTFSEYVRQDAANPKTGLVKIIKSIQPSLQSLFQGTLTKHYYYAYEKGLKETSVSTHGSAYDSGGDMIETRETFKTFLDQVLDKFEKNMMLNQNLLLQSDVKNVLKLKFALSDNAIQKLNDWFDNEENFDDIKMLAEYLLQGLHPKNEEEFCSYSIDILTTQVGNAKKNVYFLKIKEYRVSIARQLFGDKIEEMNTQTYYRVLNIISYTLVLYIKKSICKKI
jgi:hypothetical protein